ncbi:hypothetical protein LDENG_00100910 [Lucifuga dentata]|nr:hypothetical protein LDENG_00100910 [Lucifuga dentata]
MASFFFHSIFRTVPFLTMPTQACPEKAYTSLTKDLKRFDLSPAHVPCNLLLIGDHSFPLAMNSQGQILMAASLYGHGRIVVLGHKGYLTTFPALVENALTWLRGDGPVNLSVGFHESVKGVVNNLQASRFQPQVVAAFSSNLDVGVYVTDAYSVGANAKALVAFLKGGGGVLIGGQAFNWAEGHPKENILLGFPGNKVSSVAGIYFTEKQAAVECVPVYPEVPSSWLAIAICRDFEEDLQFLLNGVTEFDLQDELKVSELVFHGSLAFSIGTTLDGQAFMAGAYYGKGRVIVAAHEGLLERETLAPFWNNAIHWLDQDRRGLIGVEPELNNAYELLSKIELEFEKTDLKKDLSVFVCRAHSDADTEEIQNFVAEGGGLLIGGHTWNWAITNPGKKLMTEFSGNKIVNKMGLSLWKETVPEGSYKVPVPSQIKDNHFCHLLQRFIRHVALGEKLTAYEESCLKKLGRDCSAYVQMEARDCFSYAQMVSTLTDILKILGMPEVIIGRTVQIPRDQFVMFVLSEVTNMCSNPDALLPYLTRDYPRLPVVWNSKVKLHVTVAGKEEWVSTGLYLAPAMKSYISFPGEIVSKGWKVEWAHIIVQKAIAAPHYKSGITTADEWAVMRKFRSPWAELEFENIIITVQSGFIWKLDKPEELAAHWDKIMRGIADLAAIPHKFPCKERVVIDVQSFDFWTPTDYPISLTLAEARQVISVKNATPKELWSLFHELGRNQQRDCWQFPPHTTEATCDLWPVYVHEVVLGLDKVQAHPNLTLKSRKTRTEKYVRDGKNLKDWNSWVALETYLQLQERFGWDVFKLVFAEYHTTDRCPDNNTDKMKLFAELLSRYVQLNLAEFFRSWGWPLDRSIDNELSRHLYWVDHPMAEHNVQ